MLDARHLTLSRDRRAILTDITLSARAGEVTALIGPNGAGKSTLLAALAGDLRPDHGTIRLNGDDIATLSPRALAARRAVLTQSTEVSFPFTLGELIRLGIEATPGPADPALTDRLLAEVDLPGMADRPYHALSGGEAQRLHFARILAQARRATTAEGPVWLFLDEPVSSLDIAHQLMVMRRARRFAAEGGGVIAVLHDLNLAAMVADRVILLAQGHLLAAGTPTETLTDALLTQAYRCPIRIRLSPASGIWLLPQVAGN
jgi:iron complex transport system ATP-binding protein